MSEKRTEIEKLAAECREQAKYLKEGIPEKRYVEMLSVEMGMIADAFSECGEKIETIDKKRAELESIKCDLEKIINEQREEIRELETEIKGLRAEIKGYEGYWMRK